MLFPTGDDYAEARYDSNTLIKNDGPERDLMYFKQTIGNACGRQSFDEMPELSCLSTL